MVSLSCLACRFPSRRSFSHCAYRIRASISCPRPNATNASTPEVNTKAQRTAQTAWTEEAKSEQASGWTHARGREQVSLSTKGRKRVSEKGPHVLKECVVLLLDISALVQCRREVKRLCPSAITRTASELTRAHHIRGHDRSSIGDNRGIPIPNHHHRCHAKISQKDQHTRNHQHTRTWRWNASPSSSAGVSPSSSSIIPFVASTSR